MVKVNFFCKFSWNFLLRWILKLCGFIFLLVVGGVVYVEMEKEKLFVKVVEIFFYNNLEVKNFYILKEEKYIILKDYVNIVRVVFNDMMELQWERIEDVKDKIVIGKVYFVALVDRLRFDKELQRKIIIIGGLLFVIVGIGFSMVERGKKGIMLFFLFGLFGGVVVMVVFYFNEVFNLVGFLLEEADKKDLEFKK